MTHWPFSKGLRIELSRQASRGKLSSLAGGRLAKIRSTTSSNRINKVGMLMSSTSRLLSGLCSRCLKMLVKMCMDISLTFTFEF